MKDNREFTYDVEFINNQWWNLKKNGLYWITRTDWKIPIREAGTGYWPDQYPNNPNYQTIAQMAQIAAAMTRTKTPRPATPTQDTEKAGGLRGKAPEVFTRDQKESKKFISELNVYFKINQKHKDIINQYSKMLITLFFIKGEHVVNWVNAQVLELDEELVDHCQNDKEDKYL